MNEPTSLPAGDRALAGFERHFGGSPDVLVRAPGRVNLLGGHVDYSEGWVLPAAIEPAMWVAARARDQNRWRLAALDLDENEDLDPGGLRPPVKKRQVREATWSDYPAGLMWVLSGRELDLSGMDVAYASDVPIGAGVSSSAALEVGLLLAHQEVGGAVLDRLTMALLGRECENDYVGVGSGIMDQFASLHGEPASALLLDCRTLEHEVLRVPGDHVVLVVDSGVRRRLSSSGFNDRRAECEQAVRDLRFALPEIRTLRDVSPEALEEHRELLDPVLLRRARHAVTEMQRVREGAAALCRGDLETLGQLMCASHASSRDLYQVTIPELDVLAETAWDTRGCVGARLAGGGFGGCVLCLVAEDRAAALEERLASVFERSYGQRPMVLVSGLAAGAGVVP